MRRMVRLLTKMLLQCPSRHHCRPHLSFAAPVIVAVSSPSLPTSSLHPSTTALPFEPELPLCNHSLDYCYRRHRLGSHLCQNHLLERDCTVQWKLLLWIVKLLLLCDDDAYHVAVSTG